MMSQLDSVAVSKVPILQSIKEDTPIWWPNKQGIYSIRMAYHICLNTMIDSSYLIVAGDWNIIWNLNLPPRIKTFIWQVIKGCIPSRGKLQTHGIQCLISCVTCEDGVETYFHIFISCTKSKELWTKLGLWQDLERRMYEVDSFDDMVLTTLKSLDEGKRQIWCMCLWSLWKSRNHKLWENKGKTYLQIVQSNILSPSMDVGSGKSIIGRQSPCIQQYVQSNSSCAMATSHARPDEMQYRLFF